MRVTVRESHAGDVYSLAASLREGDRAEVEAFGLDARHAIRASYRHAILRRTYIVDGEIAAMSGLGGAMLSEQGNPWLMTAPIVERVPVAFLKIARQQLAEMLRQRRFLFNYVLASYTQACRLLEVLGFVLDPAVPMGPQGLPFRRFWIER